MLIAAEALIRLVAVVPLAILAAWRLPPFSAG